MSVEFLLFIIVLVLFLPSLFAIALFAYHKKLTVKKSFFIITAMFLQTALAIQLPLFFKWPPAIFGFIYILGSLLKSYLFCKLFKEEKKPVFALFVSLDFIVVILWGWLNGLLLEEILKTLPRQNG